MNETLTFSTKSFKASIETGISIKHRSSNAENTCEVAKTYVFIVDVDQFLLDKVTELRLGETGRVLS
jgi:hypothetical protein